MPSRRTVIRKNGIHYTPECLADSLAAGAISASGISVLDPACGDGALIAAAARRCRSLFSGSLGDLALFGCDKLARGQRAELGLPLHFVRSDFFAYRPGRTFDVILMNPPFVAARTMNTAKRHQHSRKYGRTCDVGSNADLWAYFLIKAVSHLRPGGTLGAILPWSFLQAAFARRLRIWLRRLFMDIQVTVITTPCFENTNQRVVLLWLRGYGNPANRLRIGFSTRPEGKAACRTIPPSAWDSDVILGADDGEVGRTLSEYVGNHGFSILADHADVHIGVVTGANDFFVVTEEVARSKGFRPENLVPVLTNAREVSALALPNGHVLRSLLKLSRTSAARYRDYINGGLERGYDLRSQCSRRATWYEMDMGGTPDAFFPYRVASIPLLALNTSDLQCVNSIHRVYFKGLTSIQKRWIQISLLADPGQLSLEALARTYGNGVLKVEPNALKRTPVYAGVAEIPANGYDRLCRLVEAGHRLRASKLATKLLSGALKIPRELSAQTTTALGRLRGRRTQKHQRAGAGCAPPTSVVDRWEPERKEKR